MAPLLPWEAVLVVRRIDSTTDSNLLEVIHAADALCLSFGLSQCREEHPRQDGDDGDNDQQLNEREGPDLVFMKTLHGAILDWFD